jgi:hypothetical protein
MADRLGKHELPAALEFRGALPRSAAGKLLASALRAEMKGTARWTSATPPRKSLSATICAPSSVARSQPRHAARSAKAASWRARIT